MTGRHQRPSELRQHGRQYAYIACCALVALVCIVVIIGQMVAA